MKYRNNSRKVFKVFILCTFIISVLVICILIKSKYIDSAINKDNKQIQFNRTPKNIYTGVWQFIGRARYIKGTIVSLKQSSNGRYILNLKVEFNYHSGTDPVDSSDFPFKIGEVVQFILKNKPKISLSKNKRIIIYQGQITTDEKSNFLGADIKYYEKKGKYFDMNGKEISLPPQIYPGKL